MTVPNKKNTMKKQLTGLGFLCLIITALMFAAFTPQQKDKNKNKDLQQGQDKKKDKSNKGGNGANDKNKGKDKNDDNDNHGNSGNNGDWDRAYIYTWNRETFRDRQNIKNQDKKVTICHKFRSSSDPVTLTVSSNALKAHMSHGDIMGNCPPIRNHYSDIFLRRRNDYYNYLEQSQEKVWYSRSILDYARIRLDDSRVQLVTFQNRRMPPADIERKRVAVVQLEQNVSLLEAVIGVTAGLLIDKLQ